MIVSPQSVRDGANAPPQHERIKPVLLSICQQKLKANWKDKPRYVGSLSVRLIGRGSQHAYDITLIQPSYEDLACYKSDVVA